MSQDSRGNFGVKTKVSIGGWQGEGEAGGGREGEKREKRYVENRISTGSLVCVSGVIHNKT